MSSLFVFLLCLIPFGWGRGLLDSNTSNTFNVVSYGAVGDGNTDDSQAFLKAWDAMCKAKFSTAIFQIPTSKTFLLKPVSFQGPCNSPSIEVSVLGNMVASDMSAWNKDKSIWIQFTDIHGLTIDGQGQVDGRGNAWWQCASKDGDNCPRPPALSIHGCNNLELNGLNVINSPRNHISINGCEGAKISNIHITSPEDSPNTDGINISDSTHVEVHDSSIASGDDCIAINNGCSFVNITNVGCGPGHGISIGSLGQNGDHNTVEEIHVKVCNFTRTMNGVRIKTWPGGSGYARKISFEQITLKDVNNPIIIDQYYCGGNSGSCQNHTSNVDISGITYNGLHGTSSNPAAINLNCSKSVPCTDISMNDINITPEKSGEKIYSTCINARGTSSDTSPAVPCLG
ncbi:hypothetical protein ACHQM5_029101 [Ranunculus cassubicifolius]